MASFSIISQLLLNIISQLFLPFLSYFMVITQTLPNYTFQNIKIEQSAEVPNSTVSYNK